MKLNKNEKKTLKLLLGNAKLSDSYIASKLRISSQAVGKIRRKLEQTLIDSYTINLNYAKLGIRTFAMALATLTAEGLDKGELEIEQKLLEDEHIIHVYRLPTGTHTHAIIYGFKDVNELDDYFHSPKKKQDLHNYIQSQQLFTFSHNSLIKSSPAQLFSKIIDELGMEEGGFKFNDINNSKSKSLFENE